MWGSAKGGRSGVVHYRIPLPLNHIIQFCRIPELPAMALQRCSAIAGNPVLQQTCKTGFEFHLQQPCKCVGFLLPSIQQPSPHGLGSIPTIGPYLINCMWGSAISRKSVRNTFLYAHSWQLWVSKKVYNVVQWWVGMVIYITQRSCLWHFPLWHFPTYNW